jgi:hypothetical protein
MFFNKKLIIIATVLFFGQAAAMKRKSDEPTEDQNKRAKIETVEVKVNVDGQSRFIIPSGWVPASQLPKGPQYTVVSDPIDLSVSPQEKTSLDAKIFSPYQQKTEDIEHEFRLSLHKGNVYQISAHVEKLLERNTKEPIVCEIVSSDLPLKEKKKLFNQIEKNDQSQGTNRFNQPNFIGREPLRIAVDYNNYEVAYALLQRGANPKGRDENGRPILFDVQSRDMGQLLVAHGEKIDVRDNANRTLVFEKATRSGADVEVVTWALPEGLSVNTKNIFGVTAYQEQQLSEGNANKYLEIEERAFHMVRGTLGVKPGFLRDRETGQAKLTRL